MNCPPSPPYLPIGADLDQLLATAGDDHETRVSVAREYGFDSWAALETEVGLRASLHDLDTDALRALVTEQPSLATAPMRPWRDHPGGPAPLSYVAMLRYDTLGKAWRDMPGTGELARVLVEAGAAIDGTPTDTETPLMAAASYSDAEVTRVLIEAGANLDATAAADAGGVPGGTALRTPPSSVRPTSSISSSRPGPGSVACPRPPPLETSAAGSARKAAARRDRGHTRPAHLDLTRSLLAECQPPDTVRRRRTPFAIVLPTA